MSIPGDICRRFLANPSIDPITGYKLIVNTGPYIRYVNMCKSYGYPITVLPPRSPILVPPPRSPRPSRPGIVVASRPTYAQLSTIRPAIIRVVTTYGVDEVPITRLTSYLGSQKAFGFQRANINVITDLNASIPSTDIDDVVSSLDNLLQYYPDTDIEVVLLKPVLQIPTLPTLPRLLSTKSIVVPTTPTNPIKSTRPVLASILSKPAAISTTVEVVSDYASDTVDISRLKSYLNAQKSFGYRIGNITVRDVPTAPSSSTIIDNIAPTVDYLQKQYRGAELVIVLSK
jgi:hypothetical protein